MSNYEKLQHAARLISEVNATLNNARHKCECCGLTVHEKPHEWQRKEMLSSALGKVERVAGELKRDEEEK